MEDQKPRLFEGNPPKGEGWSVINNVMSGWDVFYRKSGSGLKVEVIANTPMPHKANYRMMYTPDGFKPGGDTTTLITERTALYDIVLAVLPDPENVAYEPTKLRSATLDPENWEVLTDFSDQKGVTWNLARYRKSRGDWLIHKFCASTPVLGKAQFTVTYGVKSGKFARDRFDGLLKHYYPEMRKEALDYLSEYYKMNPPAPLDAPTKKPAVDDFAEFIGG